MTDLPQAFQLYSKANFWDKISFEDSNGCWVWNGARNGHGYGNVYVEGKYRSAHRALYEAINHIVPKCLDLDHLCRVRHCVNPDHLEPVTRSVNLRRGINYEASKTHCPQGHEYTVENTWHAKKRVARRCKICMQQRWLADYRAKRAREGKIVGITTGSPVVLKVL